MLTATYRSARTIACFLERFRGSHAERGTALVSVLLLLMMMSALAAALSVSGRTDTLVVRNHQTAAEARAAAEAGLNHATQVAIAWFAQWPNSYVSVDQAVNAVLADPTVLNPDNVALDSLYTLSSGTSYRVFLFDEDDDARPGGAQTLQHDADSTNDEDGSPDTDNNRHLVITAVGYGGSDATVELEAVIGPYTLPAIITDGDLTISGNATIIAGDNGGVHANGDLTIDGKSVIITGVDSTTGLPDLPNGTATASGNYDDSSKALITGDHGGGYSTKSVPAVRASFYRTWADYILTSGGQITGQSGAVICDATAKKNDCKNTYGWDFDKGTWSLKESNPPMGDATVYVEGPADISGAGSVLDPLSVTIIAEGSIDAGGSNHIRPDNAELLFVTDGDLKMDGNFTVHVAEGQILVHEQAEISGNIVLLGQLVIEDASNDDPLVDDTDISGNTTITYTGDVGNTLFHVNGWREVR